MVSSITATSKLKHILKSNKLSNPFRVANASSGGAAVDVEMPTFLQIEHAIPFMCLPMGLKLRGDHGKTCRKYFTCILDLLVLISYLNNRALAFIDAIDDTGTKT